VAGLTATESERDATKEDGPAVLGYRIRDGLLRTEERTVDPHSPRTLERRSVGSERATVGCREAAFGVARRVGVVAQDLHGTERLANPIEPRLDSC
jgi:hypothetical protein